MAEWHWVKVTTSGHAVLDMDSPHRKPYETLILARPQHHVDEDHATALSEHRCIVSVPSRHHSRKPPLHDIIQAVTGREDMRRLELFARHVTRGWDVWGNEALLFNHNDYYSPLSTA